MPSPKSNKAQDKPLYLLEIYMLNQAKRSKQMKKQKQNKKKHILLSEKCSYKEDKKEKLNFPCDKAS